MKVPPQVMQNVHGRRPAIDRRTTRHAGYGFILRVRKRIGEAFDWIITVGGVGQVEVLRPQLCRMGLHPRRLPLMLWLPKLMAVPS